MGVEVLTKTSVKDILTTEDGILTGLVLSNDEHFDAQMVIYAIGITPRDDLARKSGLKCKDKGGIIVDDLLNTSAPDVYAIGECASWRDHTYGLIAPGGRQFEASAIKLDSWFLQWRWLIFFHSTSLKSRQGLVASSRDRW
jgi:NAD(P)H-nitrite reductase large subunit